MCLDPQDALHRVTLRTRALMPVHFAGRPCQMDTLLELAESHNLGVIEDCAHAIETLYHGRHAGTLGDGFNLPIIQSDHSAPRDHSDGRRQRARQPDFGFAITRRFDVVWRRQSVRDDRGFQRDYAMARADSRLNGRRDRNHVLEKRYLLSYAHRRPSLAQSL